MQWGLGRGEAGWSVLRLVRSNPRVQCWGRDWTGRCHCAPRSCGLCSLGKPDLAGSHAGDELLLIWPRERVDLRAVARLRSVHAVSVVCLLAVVRAGVAADDGGAGVRAVGVPRVGRWELVANRREGAWVRLGAILAGWVVVAW